MAFTVSGKSVLITGAAMGMGRIWAGYAVEDGASTLILWDIDQVALDKAVAELSGKGTNVIGQIVNVADPTAISRAAEEVKRNIGYPDVLINNAGVVRAKYFWEADAEKDIKFTMDVNSMAPMYITLEFLASMVSNPERECRIVNIASAAGMQATPKMAVYAASKWACLGWSDSVRIELEQQGAGHVKVTTVCPSYISTGMFEGAKGPLLAPILKPEEVTTAVWKGMKNGEALIVLPKTVYLARAIKGLLPVKLYDVIADRLLGVYHSMDDFKGRGTERSGL